MAINTYAELLSGIASWMNRSDLSTIAPTFVSLVEADLNRRLRVAEMETVNAGFVVTAQRTALPAGFLEMQRVYWLGNPRRELQPVPSLQTGGGVSGLPRYYAITGGFLEIAPVQACTLELVYYSSVPDTSASAALLAVYPDVYLHGCVAQAALYVGDEQMRQTAERMYENAIGKANAAYRMKRTGPGAAMRLG